MSEKIEIIEKITKELMRLMGVKGEVQAKLSEDVVIVNLITPDAALLIGMEGETLDAFQHIVRVMTESKLGEYVSITLDTEGYRQRKIDRLEMLAAKVARNVVDSGKAEALRPMSAADRRIVHMKLKKLDGVVSESIGEGRDRKIVVKPIMKKMW